MNRGLGRIQSVSVHKEFIPFRNAAKDVGIVENQASTILAGLLMEEQSSREPGESAADNYAIVCFPCFRHLRRNLVVLAVTHGMSVLNHSLGVPC